MSTLPSTPKFTSVTLTSVFPGIKQELDTGSVQRTNFPGHYFTAQCDYPTLKKTTLNPVIGFLNAMQGGLTSFLVSLPGYENVEGAVYKLSQDNPSIDKTLSVSTSYATTTTTVVFTSTIGNSTYYNSSTEGDFFKVGDMIQFSNHDKLYTIVEQTNPNSSGQGTIKIQPGLQTAITNAHDITYSNVLGKFFNEASDIVSNNDLADTVTLTLNLREDT